MKSTPIDDFVLEPERYELVGPLPYHFELERREFFRLLGGGVAIFLFRPEEATAQESGGGRRAGHDPQPKELAAWLHVGEDGIVTAFTGKAEVGQNIRTSLTQAVAEELHVPAATVRLLMGDTDLTPYDMGTFGSRTTPFMAPLMRRAAAAARNLLLQLAAKQWQIEPARLLAVDGRISYPGGRRRLSFHPRHGVESSGKTVAQG
jgi:nicotinate dehydrogenase subunit B